VERTLGQGTFTFTGTIEHLTNIAVNYNWHAGTINAGITGLGGSVNEFAEDWAEITMNNMFEGDNQLLDVAVNIADVYDLFINICSSVFGYGGSATFLVITLRGDGEKPTFLEDQGWVEC